ncbi:Hypothetical protein CAP_5933 [Chondromyces apiculatus DSM 436]|uniref:STAS/SEC14 domain-containing protein n=1 Tax=Chondromyces apiculatus DSM 436 TaxID=1192034 RepID=A0A017TFV9_9BACT|nr:Hypothetical protein CAP_5933 [Chondromyces apiculatus DSM 436]
MLRIGPHTVKLEPPDLFGMVLDGLLLPEHVEETYVYQRILAADSGRVLLLIDLAQAMGLPAETRRMMKNAGDLPYRGIAIHGANFKKRVLGNMAVMAMNLLTGNQECPVRFFATEAEARRWIIVRRAVLVQARSRVATPR